MPLAWYKQIKESRSSCVFWKDGVGICSTWRDARHLWSFGYFEKCSLLLVISCSIRFNCSKYLNPWYFLGTFRVMFRFGLRLLFVILILSYSFVLSLMCFFAICSFRAASSPLPAELTGWSIQNFCFIVPPIAPTPFISASPSPSFVSRSTLKKGQKEGYWNYLKSIIWKIMKITLECPSILRLPPPQPELDQLKGTGGVYAEANLAVKLGLRSIRCLSFRSAKQLGKTMVQHEAPQLSEGEEVKHVQDNVTLFIDDKWAAPGISPIAWQCSSDPPSKFWLITHKRNALPNIRTLSSELFSENAVDPRMEKELSTSQRKMYAGFRLMLGNNFGVD